MMNSRTIKLGLIGLIVTAAAPSFVFLLGMHQWGDLHSTAISDFSAALAYSLGAIATGATTIVGSRHTGARELSSSRVTAVREIERLS